MNLKQSYAEIKSEVYSLTYIDTWYTLHLGLQEKKWLNFENRPAFIQTLALIYKQLYIKHQVTTSKI